MTDKRKQDESSTGHHADAHGSTPLNDAAVEQISGGTLGGACIQTRDCTASFHELGCPRGPTD